MAHIKSLSGWKPFRFFPWIERRFVGVYLDSAPNVPLDISSFWYEYRWNK